MFQSLKREAAYLADKRLATSPQPAYVSIPQAGSGLFSPVVFGTCLKISVLFQSLKREAAYLATWTASVPCKRRGVSIPQAGSGLFSR